MTRIVSPRLGISYPDPALRNEPADVPADILDIITGAEKAAIYMQGTIAARPAPSIPGRLYRTTDTKITYWDTGSAWEITSSEAVPGVMFPWPYSELSAPSGWAMCAGQAVSRAANPILNSTANASGYPHGNGDGSTTFNLPDLRGRVPAGKDNMGGTAANRISAANNGTTIGGTHGSQAHTLSEAQMPSHWHLVDSHNHGGATGGRSVTHQHSITLSRPTGGNGVSLGPSYINNVVLVAGTDGAFSPTTNDDNVDHSHSIGNESPGSAVKGSSAEHNNLQPGLIINWIIKLG